MFSATTASFRYHVIHADAAAVIPGTPDFTVNNRVTTSVAGAKADLTLTREPGSPVVVVSGTLPADAPPRTLLMALEEPALHAATLLRNLLEARGVKISGVARATHESVDLPDVP